MKVVLFANTDWYLFNFRLSLAKALRDAGHEVLLASPPGNYGPRLRALGFNWIVAPMDRRSLNPLKELKLLLWLRSILAAEKVDVIHGFTLKCAIYGSLAARSLFAAAPARVNAVAGMGYVFTSADFRARSLKPLVRIMFRIAFRGANARLVVQNEDDAKFFQTSGFLDADCVRLIPGSGVDCTRFVPAESDVGRPSRRLKVVLPARLLWDKGIREYVDAARRLLKEGRAIDFFLAGEPDPGNPASVPEVTIKAWEAEGVLRALGHVDDMPSLFRGMDLVVLPSYREGLPKGLIEAGACGLPVVTTDVPGCRDVVTDGCDGILVAARDSGGLAAAIASMQDDPEARRTYGQALRDKVLGQFDEKIVISRTIDVYRELA